MPAIYCGNILRKNVLVIIKVLVVMCPCLMFWTWFTTGPKRIAVEPFFVLPSTSENAWHALPDLSSLDWPEPPCAPLPTGRQYPNGTFYPLPKAFEPVMSCGQRNLSKRLLKLFSKVMFKNRLGDRFMLNGGTLVGSFQHHDIVPWDDDVDVLVDIRVRDTVRKLLKALGPDYRLATNPQHDKLYTRLVRNNSLVQLDIELSRHSSRYNWGWPYLDIGYFISNHTHIWDVANEKESQKRLLKDLIFPLMFRPLGLDWYPSPYNTLGYIRQVYGKSGGCAVFGYSHVNEGAGPWGYTSCWSLGKRYAFVNHRLQMPSQGVIRESKWRDLFTVGEEQLQFRTRTGPRTVHSLIMPTLLNMSDVNMYSFVDREA
ncbi:unnamed protein product [Echinostoma caproni]|uniref:Lipopolysaccharide choline phosphotransferase n=1 Tax=Echinostoma caproni TaxID=27848 RepID=A0A183A6R0_9TREM|nr:unnamed protein product [Echinostoma caproni]